MNCFSYFVYIFYISFTLSNCFAFKTVVIIHGVWDEKDSLNFLSDRIKEKHPGTKVHIINALHGWKSLAPLWTQVNLFYSHLYPIIEDNNNTINLIGYSQGGLIARGIIESFGANVSTFISLSSPQAGQYGDNFLHLFYPNLIKETVYEVFYSTLGQEVSIANYWNDPFHQKLFYKYCKYLPYINNQLEDDFNIEFKNNFVKLENFVMIGGPDDGVITPWQSSHFGFYEENSENVTEFEQSDLYLRDTFGLKTLHKAGKTRIFQLSNVHHTEWHHNLTVIDQYVIPWLD